MLPAQVERRGKKNSGGVSRCRIPDGNNGVRSRCFPSPNAAALLGWRFQERKRARRARPPRRCPQSFSGAIETKDACLPSIVRSGAGHAACLVTSSSTTAQSSQLGSAGTDVIDFDQKDESNTPATLVPWRGFAFAWRSCERGSCRALNQDDLADNRWLTIPARRSLLAAMVFRTSLTTRLARHSSSSAFRYRPDCRRLLPSNQSPKSTTAPSAI